MKSIIRNIHSKFKPEYSFFKKEDKNIIYT